MASLRASRVRRVVQLSFGIASTAIACAATAGGCAPLDVISENVCGNRVLDPGEDCDSLEPFVDAQNGYKGTCVSAGQPNECRFPVCDTTKGCAACPTGFLVGLDGICRRPSGQFLDPAIPVTITGIRPRIVDLDGDHEKDLMVDAQDSEEFAFIQGGIVRGIHSIPKALHASAAIGELRGSPNTPDIVIPTGTATLDGFALFRGTVSGPPEAYTFPVYDVGGPFRVVPISSSVLGDPSHPDAFNAGLLVDCAGGMNTHKICSGAQVTGYSVLLPAQTAPDTWRRTAGMDLANAFPHAAGPARLFALPFKNGDDACVDTVIAAVGEDADKIRLIRPCATPTVPKEIVTQPILPGPYGSCKVLNLMTSKKGNNEKVGVTLACPTGVEFASIDYPMANTPTLRSGCPSGLACDVAPLQVDCGPEVQKVRRVLATGDFNGDGIDDYAATDGIYFGDGIDDPAFTDPGGVPDQPGDFACWAQALATDLNADGIVDLAAIPPGEAGINIVLGSKSSILASTVLGTEVTVIDAAIADFDGDGTKDIAIGLDADSGETCEDQSPSDVAVLFGRAQGFPEEARTIGHVSALAQLGAGVLYKDATGLASDGIADLAAISQSAVPGCEITSGSVFAGSATRSIVTPFNELVRARSALVPPIDIKAVTIADVALADGPEIGILLNTGDNKSVVDIITTSDAPALVTNNCAPSTTQISQCENLLELPGITTVTAAAMASIDSRVATAVAPDLSELVVVAMYNGPTAAATLLKPIKPGFQAARIDLVVGDFDGDGTKDLAVIAFDRDKPKSNSTNTFVQIFHSDQIVDGGAGCNLRLDSDLEKIVGIAPLDIGLGASVVVASQKQVWRYPGIDHACNTTEKFSIPSSPDVALPLGDGDIQSVATGDLNGDGIDDVAICARDRTLILRQGTTNEYAFQGAKKPAADAGE